MLEVQITTQNLRIEGRLPDLQELVLYKGCLDLYLHGPDKRTNVNKMVCLPNQLYIYHPLSVCVRVNSKCLSHKRSECYVLSKRFGSSRRHSEQPVHGTFHKGTSSMSRLQAHTHASASDGNAA